MDDSSISRSDSMTSDYDVALTLSMLELDAQIEFQNASVSESSQSTAGNYEVFIHHLVSLYHIN